MKKYPRTGNIRFDTRMEITMIKAFKMKLYEGKEKEYERRHNELWPEMIDMIHEHGGKNYSIFLDEETNVLFGYIEIEDPEKWNQSADTAINRKWWDYMADIMETNPDNSPIAKDLKPVFHLD
jgi:L-rhamnose mutarotase